MEKSRYEKFGIWQRVVDAGRILFRAAESLDEKGFLKFTGHVEHPPRKELKFRKPLEAYSMGKYRVKGKGIGPKAVTQFRFEKLPIWQQAVDVAKELFRVADSLEEKRLFKFAEKVRNAALSIPNHIAVGSGSATRNEFKQFLNMARHSIFENASMVLAFAEDGLIIESAKEDILEELDELHRMIIAHSRSLSKEPIKTGD